MTNSTASLFNDNRNIPWYFLLVFLLIFFAGLFIGQFLGLLIAWLVTDIGFNDFMYLASPPFTDDKRVPLLLIQGIGALGGFIGGGIIYLKYLTGINTFDLFRSPSLPMWSVVQSFVLVISFMFVNTYFIEWNMNIDFPGFMQSFERWAQEKESDLAVLTEFLTEFNSPGEFLLGFIVIALITAIGEELVFRGILQNQLNLYVKNVHLSIIITAIIFSGFHFQFYGFIPRLFLGVLFGYMYYWSGNLLFPILAHFINNGFTIILVYLHKVGMIDMNIESQESFPLQVILTFGLIFVYMLFSFRRQFVQKRDSVQ